MHTMAVTVIAGQNCLNIHYSFPRHHTHTQLFSKCSHFPYWSGLYINMTYIQSLITNSIRYATFAFYNGGCKMIPVCIPLGMHLSHYMHTLIIIVILFLLTPLSMEIHAEEDKNALVTIMSNGNIWAVPNARSSIKCKVLQDQVGIVISIYFIKVEYF